MKQILKEWSVQAPWGKIALISWGNPTGQPVLLVHGRQDSAATFIPLLDLLPDDYYYVGMDFPGHGKSDPYPIGVMLSRFHFVVAVDVTVKQLGWKNFIYISHSMGGEIGFYYNAIRPNQVSKFVFLDVSPALENIMYSSPSEFYKAYENYYGNYKAMNYDDRVYTRRKALESVMRVRGLNEELASLVLSRNLNKIGEDQYKLSWDKRLKGITKLNLPYDYHLHLFTKNLPPTLYISAASSAEACDKLESGRLIEAMKKLNHFEYKIVEGSHDVHLTNPERVASDISEFLLKECTPSKL